MPRSSTSADLEQIIREAVQGVVARLAKVIADAVSQELQEQLEAELGRSSPRSARGRAPRARSAAPRARKDLTRWVPDRSARRVPSFVIEATGLDTKKKIVAKYGEDAVFEKGKALPGAKAVVAAVAEVKELPRAVKARPPLVRKAGSR
jgi:hypothetical protein